MPHCRVLVIDEQIIHKYTFTSVEEAEEKIPLRKIPLSLPFPCVWIESGSGENIFQTVTKTYDAPLNVFGLIIKEIPNGEHRYYTLGTIESTEGVHEPLISQPRAKELDSVFGEMFEDIRKSKDILMGEKRQSIKMRIGRDFLKTNRIIIVSPKKVKHKYEDQNKIEWKHTWEVMGHWRLIKGIGKNRTGDYIMLGLTWVKPHLRGEGPLVKKIRLINDGGTK